MEKARIRKTITYQYNTTAEGEFANTDLSESQYVYMKGFAQGGSRRFHWIMTEK